MESRSSVLRRLGAGFIAVACALVAVGCASEAPPLSGPILPLKPGGQAKLVKTLKLSLPGYEVQPLRPGTTWQDAGAVAGGELYKPVDTVLTVGNGGFFNGTRYQSDLVASGNSVVGVYLLTAEKFVATKEPVANSLTGISP